MRGFFGTERLPASEVREEIRAAQLSAVFGQMPTALAVNVVNGAITVIVFQRFGRVTIPLAWYCIVLLVTLGRWILCRGYFLLVVACGMRFAGCGFDVGFGRGDPAFVRASSRADFPHFCSRRDVRRGRCAQCLASPDAGSLPIGREYTD